MTEPTRFGKYSKTIREMQATIDYLGKFCESEIGRRDDEIDQLRGALENAKDYVDRAIASYAGDPADNQFQKGHLAALEIVRDEAFTLSPAHRGGAA